MSQRGRMSRWGKGRVVCDGVVNLSWMNGRVLTDIDSSKY